MTTFSGTWLPVGDDPIRLHACTRYLSDALTAVGVLRTSDTGQIDLSTGSITPPATVPVNTPVFYGFEMRRLQSPGRPTVFLRFNYFVVATAANSVATYRMMFHATAGSATDGAGNLVGRALAAFNFYDAGSHPSLGRLVSLTALRDLFIASDGANYLTFVNDPLTVAGGTARAYMNFWCERTIDPLTGQYDSDGFIGGSFGTSEAISAGFSVLNFTNGMDYNFGTTPIQAFGLTFSSSSGLDAAIIMPITVCIPKPKGPAIGCVAAFAADTTPNGQYDIAMYGVTRRYRDLGGVPGLGSGKWPYIPSANLRVLVRWD